MKRFHFVLTSALILSPAALFAQTTTAPAPAPVTTTQPTIHQRKVDQQDRVAQGVRSGQLTAGETSRLEHQEAGINKEQRGMRAQDNGKLTKADKSLVTRQQNQESRRIHRAKHNSTRR